MPAPAPLRQHLVLIDKEWAASLVGLPMLVPNSWWQAYKRDNETLNAGTMVGISFNAANLMYFKLECAGKIYAMQYDAVYLYADLEHGNYNVMKFRLPGLPPETQQTRKCLRQGKKEKQKHPCGGRMTMMRRTTRRITSPHPNATNLLKNKYTNNQK